MRDRGSPKAVAASAKGTPCFALFESAFAGSQSNWSNQWYSWQEGTVSRPNLRIRKSESILASATEHSAFLLRATMLIAIALRKLTPPDANAC